MKNIENKIRIFEKNKKVPDRAGLGRAGPGRTGPAPAGTGPAQVLFIIKYIMLIKENLVLYINL